MVQLTNCNIFFIFNIKFLNGITILNESQNDIILTGLSINEQNKNDIKKIIVNKFFGVCTKNY